MSEMGETFSAMRERSQAKRASNRESSPEILTAAGIEFTSHGGGVHLIIPHHGQMVDFWPGTGLWKFRCDGIKGRGVRNLIKRLETQ